MKFITLLLLRELVSSSLFFSYSERLSYTPDWYRYPTDYEYRTGFRTRSFESIWGWEREVGHTGILRENRYLFEVKDLNFKDKRIGTIKIGGSDYARSIWRINYQEQYAIFESTIEKFGLSFGAGLSYFWENNFRTPATCLKTTFELDNVIRIRFSQETNFMDRCYRNLYIGKSILWKIPHLPDIFAFRFEVYFKRQWKSNKLVALQNKGEVGLELNLKKILKGI